MDPITIALGLAQVVPSIVKWIAGDDAGEQAQKVVDIAKRVTGKDDGQAALDAVNADPAMAMQLRVAVLQHEATMYSAETERLKVQLADTDSARKREIDAKDWMPKALGIFVTLGFFGLLFYLIKAEPPPGSRDILNIMLGALGAGWTGMVSYYYGSSAANDKARLAK